MRLILSPFQKFARIEAAGGILLFLCTAAALLWANSPWAQSYEQLWAVKAGIEHETFGVYKPIQLWINDGLMAVFFFVVGLEIKRELVSGELAEPRQAALSIAAALGGMAVPAGLYFVFNRGLPSASGWGVPMATDIAFALGVLALLGSRAPMALKVFVTALAIVDDLGAVLVIALFYTDTIHTISLTAAAVLFAVLLAMNRLGVLLIPLYLVLGLFLWLAVLKSGLHATIAGVLLAFTIPAGRGEQLEHAIHPWVTFGILPLFALANAGVVLSGVSAEVITHPISVGILSGLVAGKPLGILLFCFVAVRAGLATLPSGVSWGQLAGAGLLAGIGFTMSLFVGVLAFATSEMLNIAKLSILAASAIAGTAGYVLLATARGREVR